METKNFILNEIKIMRNFVLKEIKKIKREFKRRGIPFVDRHTHSITVAKHLHSAPNYIKSFEIPEKIRDDFFDDGLPLEGPSLHVVDFASKAGLDEIAITDHSYEILLYPKIKERTQFQKIYGENTFEKYVEYISKVKKRYPNIKVLGGLELKIRTARDLNFIDTKELRKLDLVLIETSVKKPLFELIRKKLEDAVVIFAHPDPAYYLKENCSKSKLSRWIDSMINNNIHFEINRQHLDKFLSDKPIYKDFFDLARKKGLLFSIGSDYHCKAGNYFDFFIKVLQVIVKYNLTKENFLRFAE
jgi:histidinol phosphatase-like PHP family hydrolase